MFKDKLRNLRKHQELSQVEVARRLGISQPRYNRYETGIFQPDFDMLKKISNLFDVSIDYLLENERYLSDSEEMVDLNNFILCGRYSIHSRIPTDKERKMLEKVVTDIFEGIREK